MKKLIAALIVAGFLMTGCATNSLWSLIPGISKDYTATPADQYRSAPIVKEIGHKNFDTAMASLEFALASAVVTGKMEPSDVRQLLDDIEYAVDMEGITLGQLLSLIATDEKMAFAINYMLRSAGLDPSDAGKSSFLLDDESRGVIKSYVTRAKFNLGIF